MFATEGLRAATIPGAVVERTVPGGVGSAFPNCNRGIPGVARHGTR